MRFADRTDAGRLLGRRMTQCSVERPVIVGMARGGLPVAEQVALALGAPLDVSVVRKLGAPQQSEAAIGAIAEGGASVLDQRAVEELGVGDDELASLIASERIELDRRIDAYRQGRSPMLLGGREVVLVDDGLATGMTAVAAARSLRLRGAARVVLAVPVCAAQSATGRLDQAIDEIVCLHATDSLRAVSLWYEDFHQVTDDEVVSILQAAR